MTFQPLVSLIGGGPGAWDLITVRGMRRLQDADVILADHLGPTSELHQLCSVDSKKTYRRLKVALWASGCARKNQ